MAKKSSSPLNFAPSTIFTGDNLHVMRGMNSETIDLIYLDPPFNSDANYAAPIGSPAEGADFKDKWSLTDIDLQWLESIQKERPGLWHILKGVSSVHSPSTLSYLVYMIPRLREMHRILKVTGSIYLHCDPKMSHYLKIVMDDIFGCKNFLNEIVWFYHDSPGSRTSKYFPRKHDIIFAYAKKIGHQTFNKDNVKVPLKDASVKRYKYSRTIGNKTYTKGDTSGKTPEDVWEYLIVKKQKTSKQATWYPTQKPLPLLERIVAASSNPGDLVLDPFCGCATTCIAARRLERKWIGIDISEKAADLVDMRIAKDEPLFEAGGIRDKCIRRSDIPKRTDMGKIPKYNSPEVKKELYGLQEGYCNGCEKHFEIRNFTVDHITSEKAGGTSHISNLQLLCGHCNSVKGQKSQEQLKARLAELDIL